MKRRTLLLALSSIGALLLLALVLLLTTRAGGRWLCHDGVRIEARLYGLEDHVATVDGLAMHYYLSKDFSPERETVVLLHGFSADRQIWARFARFLMPAYNIVIPDLAGHGDTPFRTGLNYRSPAQAARVVELLDHLGIARAHIAGNSMGGFISAHFAIAYPDRTLSAGLFDPAGLRSPERSKMELMIGEGNNPFLMATPADFKTFYPLTMAKPPWLPSNALRAAADRYVARRDELKEIFDNFHENDLLDARLGEINVPTLVVWGDQDGLLHVSAAPVWAAGIPDAQLVIFEDIGHMPMFEIPEESAAVYLAFIRAASPEATTP